MPHDPIETVVARDLHNMLYLAEFTFAANKFSPVGGSEVELADAVVALDDTLMIFQIKERSAASVGAADAERAWFKNKILKEAKNQVRETVRFLSSLDIIEISNERGRTFNLASRRYKHIVKIIIHHASPTLPDDCKSVRFYQSKEAGFIHIVSYEDYVQISRNLQVPEEILRYFEYRENVITHLSAQSKNLPEASFVGGFVGDEDSPTYESYKNLHQVIDDAETWDLIPLLSGMHDHQSDEDYSDDYYRILTEFMRLPRSMWREVKLRLSLGVEKVSVDEFAIPYRVSYPGRDIGVVILPMDSGYTSRSNWNEIKKNSLITITGLHKFDHKLGKSIGILIAKIGDMFDIQWCMIESEWEEDLELRQRLDKDSPFRDTSEKMLFGFHTAK